MKKIALIVFIHVVFTGFITGQNTAPEPNSIAIVGEATTEVTPDEFYITIELNEYYEGKTKISIDTLERQLRLAANRAGIPQTKLQLDDMGTIRRYKRFKDDEQNVHKTYRLILDSAQTVSRLFLHLSKTKIVDAEIDYIDYSKKDELIIKMMGDATRNAKNKALSALAPIDGKLGKPRFVTELKVASYTDPEDADEVRYDYIEPKRISSVGYYSSSGIGKGTDLYNQGEEFKKITYYVAVSVNFLIE